MSKCEAKEKIIILANAVRAETMFDLQFNINESDFYRAEFEYDEKVRKEICKAIYK